MLIFVVFQSVWGSYWREFQWGYACCHSFIKMSYCTGEAGKVANEVGAVSQYNLLLAWRISLR